MKKLTIARVVFSSIGLFVFHASLSRRNTNPTATTAKGAIPTIFRDPKSYYKAGEPSVCLITDLSLRRPVSRPASHYRLFFGDHRSERMTPTLTGAQPAVYTSNGKTVRVLAEENDKAFALLNALDESQRKQAILNYRIDDLVAGPGHAGETIQPEGLKAAAMNEKQRTMLLDVISEWAGIVNDAYAKPRMAEIKAGLDETYFAWSGPTTHEPGRNGASYYRIQGPKLIIEFSPQGVGGDPTMHLHTMYRDPTNDYGRAFTNNSN
ncbi:MAG: DUF3500 domain-containing protein [Bryobacteraceae bacterium]